MNNSEPLWNVAIEQSDPSYIAMMTHGESLITFIASVLLMASAVILALKTKLKGRYVFLFAALFFVLSSIALGFLGSFFNS